jgi:hypothetical protein
MRVARVYAVGCDAAKIRALRGARTRGEIAELARVSPGVVAVAESPGGRVSIRILERLAAVLDVSAEELRIRAPISTPPRVRERGIRVQDLTSFGLGSSLSVAVVNDDD